MARRLLAIVRLFSAAAGENKGSLRLRCVGVGRQQTMANGPEDKGVKGEAVLAAQVAGSETKKRCHPFFHSETLRPASATEGMHDMEWGGRQTRSPEL